MSFLSAALSASLLAVCLGGALLVDGAGATASTTSSATVPVQVSPVVSYAHLIPGKNRDGSNRSGLTWPSGAYVNSGSPHDYALFGRWRGHKLDVSVMWSSRQTWSDIVNPSWLYDTWSNMPVIKVIGVAPVPEGDNSATMARCAEGAYDDKWTEFARNIKAAGMDHETIIRLGWEFNGNWYKWSAKNPETFVQCWRNIVGTAEKTAPGLKWDWTVNRGVSAGLANATKAWPGSRYVDMVGVDSYDIWPGATSTAAWSDHINGTYGLNYWLKFAKAHGKKLSVPEWGVYPGSAQAGHNGGDNAYYVKRMVNFFRANAKHIAYESYFNESASYYQGSLYGPTQNPKAATAYRASMF